MCIPTNQCVLTKNSTYTIYTQMKSYNSTKLLNKKKKKRLCGMYTLKYFLRVVGTYHIYIRFSLSYVQVRCLTKRIKRTECHDECGGGVHYFEGSRATHKYRGD